VTEPYRGTFEVKNRLGLHARAATKLVQLASKFPCEIVIGHGNQVANAKSVMGVLLLCGSKGTTLSVEATGERADEAVRQIGALIDSRFGEDE
jgi:phosphocarrier protein